MKIGEIEKNIPKVAADRGQKWPFKDMLTGDSFLITVETREEYMKAYRKARTAAFMYGSNNNKKFSIRTLTPLSFRI